MEFIITQASSFAKDIDNLIILIFYITGFWLILAQFIFVYFIVKYRKSKNATASYISGDNPKDKKFIKIADVAIILCDIVIIFFAIVAWYNIKQVIPPPDETIRVVGYQWAWKFVHPGADKQLDTEDDIVTVDELHLRKDALYNYKLQSVDVLHSFSIPAFRLKQDAIPGREILGWFKPIKTGNFDFQCAEICGIGHGVMYATVQVYEDAEYEQWILENSPVVASQ